ncbi:MAG TPA: hypothetical protein VHA75_03610, partial [Rugosimonospora sp.]|nr:hypothetical protein [Rugosimonospora sp.]
VAEVDGLRARYLADVRALTERVNTRRAAHGLTAVTVGDLWESISDAIEQQGRFAAGPVPADARLVDPWLSSAVLGDGRFAVDVGTVAKDTNLADRLTNLGAGWQDGPDVVVFPNASEPLVRRLVRPGVVLAARNRTQWVAWYTALATGAPVARRGEDLPAVLDRALAAQRQDVAGNVDLLQRRVWALNGRARVTRDMVDATLRALVREPGLPPVDIADQTYPIGYWLIRLHGAHATPDSPMPRPDAVAAYVTGTGFGAAFAAAILTLARIWSDLDEWPPRAGSLLDGLAFQDEEEPQTHDTTELLELVTEVGRWLALRLHQAGTGAVELLRGLLTIWNSTAAGVADLPAWIAEQVESAEPDPGLPMILLELLGQALERPVIAWQRDAPPAVFAGRLAGQPIQVAEGSASMGWPGDLDGYAALVEREQHYGGSRVFTEAALIEYAARLWAAPLVVPSRLVSGQITRPEFVIPRDEANRDTLRLFANEVHAYARPQVVEGGTDRTELVDGWHLSDLGNQTWVRPPGVPAGAVRPVVGEGDEPTIILGVNGQRPDSIPESVRRAVLGLVPAQRRTTVRIVAPGLPPWWPYLGPAIDPDVHGLTPVRAGFVAGGTPDDPRLATVRELPAGLRA